MSNARFAFRAPLALVLLATIAGCDTMGMNFGAPSTPAAPAARAINYKTDDLGSLVFAIDVPETLRPAKGPVVASFDATNGGKGDKHLKANLVLADGDAVSAGLPPPAAGRTYYIYGFADKDKAALRSAQNWLKMIDAPPVIVLDVAPKLCTSAPTDPKATKYSVIPALPGTPLLPLVANAPASRLIAMTGGDLPPC